MKLLVFHINLNHNSGGDFPFKRSRTLPTNKYILPQVVYAISAAVVEVHTATTVPHSGGLVLRRCLDGCGVCGGSSSRRHL